MSKIKDTSKSLVKKPYFQGGDEALKIFVQSHLQYPSEAMQLGIEGSVHLKYEIGKEGNIKNVKIIKSLHPLCDMEAERVVKMLTFVMPSNDKHLKLTFHKTISIHFYKNMEYINTQQKPKPEVSTLQYNYIPNQAKPSTIEKASENTIQYTIHYTPLITKDS